MQTNVDLHNKINTGSGINEKEFLITLKNKSKIGLQTFCNGAYILGLWVLSWNCSTPLL